jgi:N-acetyl-gamma-glutamyl-phosphate reductase
MTLRVAIAGASGYAGGEVARLLAEHPEFEVTTLTAHSSAGRGVTEVHPHLASYSGMSFDETSLQSLAGHDVVILAMPHGESGALGEQLVASGDQRLLIDLGADRRLVDPDAWATFYGGTHYDPFVYSLPELVRVGAPQRELIASASALAAPGCNATAVTLALAPLIQAQAISSTDIQAVLAVGPSGAGRVAKSNLMASELLGSAEPYAVGGVHRHIPEIAQNLGLAGASDVSLSLTPVLVPMSRGILATCSARLSDSGPRSAEDIHELLHTAYREEPFVTVLPLGSFPKTADVLGSNRVSLGVALDRAVHRVIVVAAIDNLVKGTAGAAVQGMNLVFGFPETTGLSVNGVAP